MFRPARLGGSAVTRIAGMFLVLMWLGACDSSAPPPSIITISIVGTNDIHGQLEMTGGHGSLVDISAYVNALRAARAADGGAVIVVDAGDMWQGTLASNLTEGASMVAAYNALGVAAATIGNHEFDFGPVGPAAVPVEPGHDPQGALKQRAREADFPILAANLIDNATGLPVNWENVRPSTLLEVQGVQVGVIGVLTANGLALTIAPNTAGLSLTPLAGAIDREARLLRQQGADLVIVVAHAGGRCSDLSDPHDSSSCNPTSELISVVNELEPGIVDHVFGGHLDNPLAHVINDISVSVNLKSADSFGRVDFRVERDTGEIVERKMFPPQANVLPRPDTYEGQALVPVPEVEEIADAALQAAAALQARPLGVELEAPFSLGHDMESALFGLVTSALLESFEADIVFLNVRGGLRKGLPQGPLTYGHVYEMFPFDNIATIHEISGQELRHVIATEATRFRRTGFAGMRAYVTCDGNNMNVDLRRADGTSIEDGDSIRLLANDFLAHGGDSILTPIIPAGGFEIHYDRPLMRDALVAWLQNRGGTLNPANWQTHEDPKWNLPSAEFTGCAIN